MSKLIQRLRNKKTDTKIDPVPNSTKKGKNKKSLIKKHNNNATHKETLPTVPIVPILESFITNKEAISRLNKQNDEYKDKIKDYTKDQGARTDKGHSLFRAGDMIAEVRRSVATILNSEAVEKLLHKLLKKKLINKKQYNKIFFAEHTIVLSQAQFDILRPHLEQAGVITDTRHRIDEDELKLLLTQGILNVNELEKCYTQEVKESLYAYRLEDK